MVDTIRRSTPWTALACALAVAVPSPATAQRGTMEWRELDVEARLDGQGSLHVRERQVIVFDGPWNGGERIFRVGRGQRLRFERMLRESGPGVEVPMVRGELDSVDHWDFTSARTLRWRSRAPTDPPFASTALAYVLEYTLEGVLEEDGGGGFHLSHDFAFPSRAWPIRSARGRLVLDPEWEPAGGIPLEVSGGPLPPGRSLVMDVALRWVGPGTGPARAGAIPGRLRVGLGLAMLAGLMGAAFAVWRHGAARGQFSSLPPTDRADEAWVRRHVLSLPPEVVGAAWDDHVGPPEVAAVLARMASEGRLSTRVEAAGWGPFRRDQLHMELRVDRRGLAGLERVLVDGIFVDGATIDTARLAAHYQQEGFDPAALLRPDLELRVATLAPPGPPAGAKLHLLAAAATLAAAAALAWSAVGEGTDPGPHVPLLVALGALPLLAAILAISFRRRVDRHALAALPLLLLLGAWGAAVLWAAAGGLGLDARQVVAHAGAWLAALVAAVGVARTPLGPERFLLRRRLSAARAWLRDQLRSDRPRLEDAWTPYLLALGLGPDVDRWTRVHGRSSAPSTSPGADTFGRGPSSERWTGGGGGFSGGGATATWAALGGIAASIPAASSGSDGGGGGGGGGGSSGGGGGGGW